MGTAHRAGAEGRGPERAESTLPSRAVSKDLKADGSREHSEPWSEGGGNRQLSWLFILTKPKRKNAAKRNKSAFPSVCCRGEAEPPPYSTVYRMELMPTRRSYSSTSESMASGLERVVKSPSSSICPATILRSTRRIILPERVLGKPSVN